MHRASRTVRWVGVLVAVGLAGACVSDDLAPVEPLSGGIDDPRGPEPALSAEGDPDVLGNDVALDDLEAGMFGEAPPGFGEVPYEELDLPPDEPPPPLEGGGSAAPAPPPASPSPTQPPPPPRPSGSPDVSAVAAVGDYCTLFREHGGVTQVVNETLANGPAARIPEVLSYAEAVFARGADLGPGNLSGDHRRIADAMRSYREVLADYGNSLEAAASDDAGASRIAAIETPAFGTSVINVADHVSSACGISIF